MSFNLFFMGSTKKDTLDVSTNPTFFLSDASGKRFSAATLLYFRPRYINDEALHNKMKINYQSYYTTYVRDKVKTQVKPSLTIPRKLTQDPMTRLQKLRTYYVR